MTEEERAALDWLEHVIGGTFAPAAHHARTLKAMLSRPALPDVNDHAAIDELMAEFNRLHFPSISRGALVCLLAIMREPPKPAWGVSAGMGWVHFATLDAALEAARVELLGGNEVQIRKRPA
jgi:hypothetical protein